MDVLLVSKAVCTAVIGMKIDDAKEAIRVNGLVHRVVSVDGMYYYGNDDVNPLRINLEVVDGRVIDARAG